MNLEKLCLTKSKLLKALHHIDIKDLFWRALSFAIVAAPALAQSYTFQDGNRFHTYLKTSDLYVTSGPRSTASKSYGKLGWISSNASALAKSRPTQAVPVFLDASELPASVRKQSTVSATDYPSAIQLMTPRLLVNARNEDDWNRLMESTGAVSHSETLLAGWHKVEYRDAWAALDALDWLAKDSGWQYTPAFARQWSVRATNFGGPLKRAVNDPLFPNQWHFNQPSLNLNMGAAWDFVTGKNINITIVDDGLDINSPDLKDAAYPLSTNYHRNFNDTGGNNPAPSDLANHGTNCGGLAAARGFNGEGLDGVAPEARLMGLRLIAGPTDPTEEAEAMAWQPAGTMVHVSSNSWGPPDDGKAGGRLTPVWEAGIKTAAEKNRAGLGTVLVVSGGNGRTSNDDSSYDEFASSRYAIAVGAVNRTGKQSSFSENGVDIAISAFGGEFSPPEVLWTTNVAGNIALELLKQKFPSSTAPMNYSDAFNGTSAAAPQVSGAVALLLERNPKLSYRDVKEILIKSARKTGLTGEDSTFADNKSGFSFSHSFGAGLLDVAAALTLADDWTNLGPLLDESISRSNLNLDIPDDDLAGASVTFDFSGQRALRVEHVDFTVNATHANRGDLAFILTSPTGMQSVAEPRPNDKAADFVEYRFGTPRNWGTNSQGVWTLKVLDATGNGIAGVLNSATVRVYGTAVSGSTGPVITPGGVVKSRLSGGSTTIAVGNFIEIYGKDLSATTRTATAGSMDYPVSLDGVSVTIDGQAAGIFYVSPGQIDVQVPRGVSTGMVPLVVKNALGSSDIYLLKIG